MSTSASTTRTRTPRTPSAAAGEGGSPSPRVRTRTASTPATRKTRQATAIEAETGSGTGTGIGTGTGTAKAPEAAKTRAAQATKAEVAKATRAIQATASTAPGRAAKQPARSPRAAAGDAVPAARPAPRQRRTQEQRREESELRMLEAALALVAEKGTVRVTLAEIGERAGYSRGLPAHRFGSKARLLATLAAFIHERFGQQWMPQPAEPGLPTIEAVIRAYFTRDASSLTTTRALIVMMAEGGLGDSELQPILADYNRKLHRYYVHHIERAQQAGQARADVDAHSLAVVLLSAFRGAMLQRLNDPDIQLDRVRDEVLALVRARLLIDPS